MASPGIVQFNPALFAKLASPPPTAGLEAMERAGQTVAAAGLQYAQMRQKAISEEKERKHELGVEKERAKIRLTLQDRIAEAKRQLTEFTEGQKNLRFEASTALAQQKLKLRQAEFASLESYRNKRLEQFGKQLDLTGSAQDSLNAYRGFLADMKAKHFKFEQDRAKIQDEFDEKGLKLRREQVDLMAKRFAEEQADNAKDFFGKLLSASQRAAARIGSSGDPGAIETLRAMALTNEKAIDEVFEDLPEAEREGYKQAFHSMVLGTGMRQPTNLPFNIMSGLETPDESGAIAEYGKSLREAFRKRGVVGIPVEEDELDPAVRRMADELDDVDILTRQVLDTAAGATSQPRR